MLFLSFNRDQRTPIFEPEKWNENALVVDAWAGHVYTKKEFSVANTTFPHYGLCIINMNKKIKDSCYFCHLFGLESRKRIFCCKHNIPSLWH
jgi:hypothetical protein